MQCYTTIFDCYEWLPGYGEYDIVIHPRGKGCDRKKHGGCIIVDIFYDNQNEKTKKVYPFAKRSYIFKFVSSFHEVVWPIESGGIDPICPQTPCKTKESIPLGVLFEINNSLLAQKWDEHWEESVFKNIGIGKNRQLRQYFLEASIMIDVICQDVELTDEILIQTEEWEWERL